MGEILHVSSQVKLRNEADLTLINDWVHSTTQQVIRTRDTVSRNPDSYKVVQFWRVTENAEALAVFSREPARKIK